MQSFDNNYNKTLSSRLESNPAANEWIDIIRETAMYPFLKNDKSPSLSVDWINAFSDPSRGKIIFSPGQRGFGGHSPPAVLLIQGSVSCLY